MKNREREKSRTPSIISGFPEEQSNRSRSSSSSSLFGDSPLPDLFDGSAFGADVVISSGAPGNRMAPENNNPAPSSKAKKRLIPSGVGDDDVAGLDFSQDDSLFDRIPDVNANRWVGSLADVGPWKLRERDRDREKLTASGCASEYSSGEFSICFPSVNSHLGSRHLKPTISSTSPPHPAIVNLHIAKNDYPKKGDVQRAPSSDGSSKTAPEPPFASPSRDFELSTLVLAGKSLH